MLSPFIHLQLQWVEKEVLLPFSLTRQGGIHINIYTG